MSSPPIQIGLERCLEDPPEILRGRRFGLLMNQASVDRTLHYACDLLAARFPGQLTAIFSPQHGLWGEEQANMIESPHGRYEPLDLPVYSLYSETRQPTAQMLGELDCLVIDLQDVGTRVYTFAWTLQQCLIACAEANRPVVVLDRPNPIGGTIAEGPMLAHGYESFVGGASIPLRHGLTLGELARFLNAEQKIGATLEVVPMAGWRRGMQYHDTGRAWVAPSPNMPRARTALFYPGQVLLEGTNLSEGRGTTTPFEVVGAPFIDPHALASELAALKLPGLAIRPIRFVPTFDKWSSQPCGGLALHALDTREVRSVTITLQILAAVRRLYPNDFAWLPPPYEYEHEKMPIDILFGSSRLRQALLSESPLSEATMSDATINDLARLDEAAWWRRVQPYLLYN
ncbi:MAG TPA: DUF1343 domain-containing protein [Pirellulaceae bacterium]|nr:DUF1343 domain-containing protein [Pirellulaceae bacterium]